ncbi:unnamed protein product [Schistosoma haematobium]|nr:unnamed protein product [Schistosoma haematobium]
MKCCYEGRFDELLDINKMNVHPFRGSFSPDYASYTTGCIATDNLYGIIDDRIHFRSNNAETRNLSLLNVQTENLDLLYRQHICHHQKGSAGKYLQFDRQNIR